MKQVNSARTVRQARQVQQGRRAQADQKQRMKLRFGTDPKGPDLTDDDDMGDVLADYLAASYQPGGGQRVAQLEMTAGLIDLAAATLAAARTRSYTPYDPYTHLIRMLAYHENYQRASAEELLAFTLLVRSSDLTPDEFRSLIKMAVNHGDVAKVRAILRFSPTQLAEDALHYAVWRQTDSRQLVDLLLREFKVSGTPRLKQKIIEKYGSVLGAQVDIVRQFQQAPAASQAREPSVTALQDSSDDEIDADLCTPGQQSQDQIPTFTVQRLEEEMGASYTVECQIQLACRVVMPKMTVKHTIWLVSQHFDLELDGRVIVSLHLKTSGHQKKISNFILDSFFYNSPLPAAYREALAIRTKCAGHAELRAPHVFMLLIDEIVYWVNKTHKMTPQCVMSLNDMVNLDYAPGTTPFLMHGRHMLRRFRGSRYLQNLRGYGYYETFGFWPDGAQPTDYMNRKSQLSGQMVIGPGDPGYTATAREVDRNQTKKLHKTFPPVLPPLAGGNVRRFDDMEDYYHQVIVAGNYGKAAGVVRPVRDKGALVELAEPNPDSVDLQLRRINASELITEMRVMNVLEPAVVEDVPAPQPIKRFDGYQNMYLLYFQLGQWVFRCMQTEIYIEGPLSLVRQVTQLAHSITKQLKTRDCIIWDFRKHHRKRVFVQGKAQQTGDGRFLAHGTEMLIEQGYVPASRPRPGYQPVQDAAALLKEARLADDQFGDNFVVLDKLPEPRFMQLSRIASALANDVWIRPAPPLPPIPPERPTPQQAAAR